MSANDRRIELVSIKELKSADRNARTHPPRQIALIARSIKRFGFTSPALINDDNQLLAGHGRVEAAKEAGFTEIPCIRLSSLTKAEQRAYVIADNQLALKAEWDFDILALELGEQLESGFEIDLTGFEQAEIDQILCDAKERSTEEREPENDHPKPSSPGKAVSRIDDLWTLGRHSLICGDAKDARVLDALMAGAKANMVFTDAPYNLRIDGHVSGLGKHRHREFAEASGEMSRADYTQFLRLSYENIERACCNGAIIYSCMDWRHMGEMLEAGYAAFTHLMNVCVWAKTNGGMGTFYRSQHELVFVWKVGDAPHTNNFGLGDKGRYRTNVWTYPGVNTFKAERAAELASHPTVKPVALVADAIRDVSNRGEVVLDVFGGSGTTLIAAEKTGRAARLIELDPVYCDVIIRRWQKLTGKRAVLSTSGADFDTVAAERLPNVLEKSEVGA